VPKKEETGWLSEADARTRTGDPFITRRARRGSHEGESVNQAG
jgi:hypothetical protein